MDDGELRAILNTLVQGQTDLRTELTGLHEVTAGLRTELTGLRMAMMDRFERIEDKLTSLQEDVSVNMMAVTHQQRLRTSEREASDQLTALVLKMEQQILRLQTDVDELKKAS